MVLIGTEQQGEEKMTTETKKIRVAVTEGQTVRWYGATYQYREEFKAAGYRWTGGYWQKTHAVARTVAFPVRPGCALEVGPTPIYDLTRESANLAHDTAIYGLRQIAGSMSGETI
jgi:hypothetical protein